MTLELEIWFRFIWFCNSLWPWLIVSFLQTVHVLVFQLSQLERTHNIINSKYLVIFLLQQKLCKCESYLNLPILSHCHLIDKERLPKIIVRKLKVQTNIPDVQFERRVRLH